MVGYNGMMELIDVFGESYILKSLIRALSDDELFDTYCYICKNEDFSGQYLDDCDM